MADESSANGTSEFKAPSHRGTISRTQDEMIELVRALAENDMYEFSVDVDAGAGDFLAQNIIRVLDGDLLVADEVSWRAKCIERLADWIVGSERTFHIPHFAGGEEIEIEVSVVGAMRGRLALMICGDSVERFTVDEIREIEMVPAACQALCEYDALVAEFEHDNGPLYTGVPARDNEYALIEASRSANDGKKTSRPLGI